VAENSDGASKESSFDNLAGRVVIVETTSNQSKEKQK